MGGYFQVEAAVPPRPSSHAMNYERDITRQFEDASRCTFSALGARFEILAIRKWAHSGGRAPMAASLAQLQLDEPGGQASSPCDKALAAWPESSLAHCLLGVLGELDPAVDGAYFRLAAALRSQGKTASLDVLKAKSQSQFSRPLP